MKPHRSSLSSFSTPSIIVPCSLWRSGFFDMSPIRLTALIVTLCVAAIPYISLRMLLYHILVEHAKLLAPSHFRPEIAVLIRFKHSCDRPSPSLLLAKCRPGSLKKNLERPCYIHRHDSSSPPCGYPTHHIPLHRSHMLHIFLCIVLVGLRCN